MSLYCATVMRTINRERLYEQGLRRVSFRNKEVKGVRIAIKHFITITSTFCVYFYFPKELSRR